MSERATGCLILRTVTVSPLFLHHENTQVYGSYRGSQWCICFINAKCSLDMKSTIFGKIISAWLCLFHMRFFTRKRFLKWLWGKGEFITRIYVLEYSGKLHWVWGRAVAIELRQALSCLLLSPALSFFPCFLSQVIRTTFIHSFHHFLSTTSLPVISLHTHLWPPALHLSFLVKSLAFTIYFIFSIEKKQRILISWTYFSPSRACRLAKM